MITVTIRKSVHRIGAVAFFVTFLLMTTTTWASSTKYSRLLTKLRSFQEAARVYHQKHGVYPATDENGSWYEKMLLNHYLPTDDWETTSDGSLPIDESGNLFIYELPLGADATLSEQSKPILRWVGDNGIDDQGKGDDIDLRFGVNYGYNYKSRYPYALATHIVGLLLTIALIRPFFLTVTTWKYRISSLLLWLSVWSGAGGIIGSHGLYGDIAEFSIWGLFLGIISCFACGLGNWIMRQRHADLRLSNVCVVCKYDLRATEGPICPECGNDKTDY